MTYGVVFPKIELWSDVQAIKDYFTSWSVDGMKRLTPHSTWWHRLPHRETALTGA